MAQSKPKRRRKHRGTQAGTIERAGPHRARPRTREEAKQIARQRRAERLDSPPTWRGAVNRAAIAAAVFGVLVVLLFGRQVSDGVFLAAFMFLLYIPLGYATDTAIYRFRQRRKRQAAVASRPMDVRMFTVGPVAENCFLFRREGSDRALIVDPGEEAPKLLGAIEQLGRRARGHPAHPHPLRPRGRGGAGREGHRRRGLGARDREAGARGHHELRAVARASGRSRATTPSTR